MNSWRSIKGRVRRKRRQRMGLILMMTLVTAAFIFGTNNAFSADESVQMVEVVVQQGDTLWDIAARHTAGRDLRRVVWEMRQVNSLEDVNIHPGQILYVPK